MTETNHNRALIVGTLWILGIFLFGFCPAYMYFHQDASRPFQSKVRVENRSSKPIFVRTFYPKGATSGILGDALPPGFRTAMSGQISPKGSAKFDVFGGDWVLEIVDARTRTLVTSEPYPGSKHFIVKPDGSADFSFTGKSP